MVCHVAMPLGLMNRHVAWQWSEAWNKRNALDVGCVCVCTFGVGKASLRRPSSGGRRGQLTAGWPEGGGGLEDRAVAMALTLSNMWN